VTPEGEEEEEEEEEEEIIMYCSVVGSVDKCKEDKSLHHLYHLLCIFHLSLDLDVHLS